MNRLEEDLARWEADLLSLQELEARHPGEDVRGLVDLWVRLQAEGQRPAPDPAAGWAALEPLLEPRAGAVVPLWRRRAVRRAVVLAAAAVLGVGAVAYAAGPEGLRREVNGTVVRIVQFLEPGGSGPSPSSPGEDRSDRSGPGSDDRRGQAEDEGPSDRSGPGGGQDEREDDRSGPGEETEEAEEPAEDDRDESSGPGSGGERADGDDGADDSGDSGSAERDDSGGDRSAQRDDSSEGSGDD